MPAGRPSTYTAEIVDEICEAIAQGGALYLMCQERENWPAESTVYKWLEEHKEFSEKYIRARERQADREADEIVVIADDSGFDAQIVDGRAVVNSESVNRARLRVDARKWRASKLAPKKYGDKITNEITGKDGGPVIIVTGVPRADD